MSSTYLRFLSRNKLYTFIEVFGLSVALGFVILLASYARTEFSVGAKQPLSRQLYVIGAGNSFGMTLGTSEEFSRPFRRSRRGLESAMGELLMLWSAMTIIRRRRFRLTRIFQVL